MARSGHAPHRRVLPVLGLCTMLVVYVQVVVLNPKHADRHTDRHTDIWIERKRENHFPWQNLLDSIKTTSDSLLGSRTGVEYADFQDAVREFLDHFDKKTFANVSPPFWQRDLYNRTINHIHQQKYFLTELLMVRLYSSDKAKMTMCELKQWMHYMFLIGIEHIYICDHYHEGDINMQAQLVQYIALGLVSYTRIYKQEPMKAQVQCYRHWLSRERQKSSWMTSVDMDEYPYVVQDKRENCLKRHLHTFLTMNPNVGEISMPNYLMLGQGDRTKDTVVDRIRRVTPKAANKLFKPIFQTKSYVPGIHKGSIRNKKKRVESDPRELRMLHYWGSRLQDWGPDTPYILNITVPFSDMADTWALRIRNSLLTFGEIDAFSSKTGP